MTEPEYKKLCSVCDDILAEAGGNMQNIAIPWLHVLREHPEVLKQYNGLLGQATSSNRDFIRKAKWSGYRHLLRSLLNSDRRWKPGISKSADADVVIVSHLLNERQAGSTDDFYFGTIPSALTGIGKKVVIVLLNHSGVPAEKLGKQWDNAAVPRIVLTPKLSLRTAISYYWQMWVESRRLRRSAKQQRDPFIKNVLMRASGEALSGGTLANMRLYGQIRQIIHATDAKNIFVTYEGHAYERMVFCGARKSNPSINCIAYQHSGLFRLQHSIRKRIGYQYDPDTILTSGQIAAHQLRNEIELRGIAIETLGSNRSFSVTDNVTSSPGTLKCLVLPEGFEAECNLLFGFSLKCARLFPQVTFIWRLHPVITFEKLKTNNPVFNELPANITLSTEDFDTDLERTSMALYRGTSAVIKAVCKGLTPVYLSVSGEMSIDLLYEIKKGRHIVRTEEEFGKACMPNSISETDAQDVREYCMRYFVAYRPGVLANNSFVI